MRLENNKFSAKKQHDTGTTKVATFLGDINIIISPHKVVVTIAIYLIVLQKHFRLTHTTTKPCK